ncbi:MAG: hypothetical protein PVF75_01525 [Granulosicoccaceae bacterium]|jgi:hypothetical protein
MEFTDVATEQTTAATDAILAVILIVAAVYVHRSGRQMSWKSSLWSWVFSLLAAASILGAIAHGLELAKAHQTLLWHSVYVSLGLSVALFIVAIAYDIWGVVVARRLLPIMLIIGSGFFVLTLIGSGDFEVFIIYESVAMLFALGGYVWLACYGRLDGAWLMAAGILVSIVAAVVQAGNAVLVTLIWPFDNNGVYHLIQMIGVILLMAGLRTALLSRI